MLAGSKKLTVFVGSVIVLALSTFLNIPEATAQEFVGLVISYLLAQGVADGLSKGATSGKVNKRLL